MSNNHRKLELINSAKPYVLLTAMLLGCGTVRSQGIDVSKGGTTAATFLEIGVGAPAAGMGGAYVSVANNATALYWNPSATATLDRFDVAIVHTNWIADTRFDFAGIVVPLSDFGTLGFSLTSLSMSDMKVRTVEFPEGTGEFFSAGDLAAAISYSRRLTDRFAIGITAKYIQQSIWHERAMGFAVDVGTIFKTDLLGGLTIGATLSNFGTGMQMAGRDARRFVRIDPTLQGTNDRIPTDIEFDSWSLPLLFQFGISTRVVNNNEYHWTVAIDALHPNDNYESLNLGTEFAYGDFLFLRAGYQSLLLRDAEGGMSVGGGMASSDFLGTLRLSFDYAYQDMGRLLGVHVFTLGLHF